MANKEGNKRKWILGGVISAFGVAGIAIAKVVTDLKKIKETTFKFKNIKLVRTSTIEGRVYLQLEANFFIENKNDLGVKVTDLTIQAFNGALKIGSANETNPVTLKPGEVYTFDVFLDIKNMVTLLRGFFSVSSIPILLTGSAKVKTGALGFAANVPIKTTVDLKKELDKVTPTQIKDIINLAFPRVGG